MAILKPFKAFRPTVEKAAAIASHPYDVLNTEEAREKSGAGEHQFLHVVKPEIDFPLGHDPYATAIYERGKENFARFVSEGAITQDETENFYLYELTMNGSKQRGIVGCCSIDDYFNNVIKKHELTRPDKEEDRKNHVRYSRLNYEPVFFSYPEVDAIDKLVDDIATGTPVYDFTSEDRIHHTLWLIEDRDTVSNIESLFTSRVPAIYVADGHHRTAAGALVGKEFRESSNGNQDDGERYNYFMAVLFPANQLQIIDYNRVVKDLNGKSSEEFIAQIEKSFDIQEKPEQYRPEALHTIGMYLEGQWYKLASKEGTYNDNDPVEVLDVTILSKQILEPILDIVDLRRDKRIDFVGGIRGLDELERRVDSGEMRVAFAMHPVSMQQLMDISDNDMIMPPKVTWFEPKLRSGLFVHSLEN